MRRRVDRLAGNMSPLPPRIGDRMRATAIHGAGRRRAFDHIDGNRDRG